MTEQRKFKIGDRVKRSDADNASSIPAYRDMRGTVTGFDWTHVEVQWDCDKKYGQPPVSMLPEWLALDEDFEEQVKLSNEIIDEVIAEEKGER